MTWSSRLGRLKLGNRSGFNSRFDSLVAHSTIYPTFSTLTRKIKIVQAKTKFPPCKRASPLFVVQFPYIYHTTHGPSSHVAAGLHPLSKLCFFGVGEAKRSKSWILLVPPLDASVMCNRCATMDTIRSRVSYYIMYATLYIYINSPSLF